MTPSPRDLGLVPPLAVAVVLACVAVAIYLFRAHSRHQRRIARRRASRLSALFPAYLAGRVPAEVLIQAVDSAPAGDFWTALEKLSVRLAHRHWRKLARLLEGHRHCVAERAALRDDSPWRRELAARRLGLLPSDLTRRALRRALRRGPEMVTLAAARALARHADRAALRWLMRHPEALARRPYPGLVSSLRAFGPKAIPTLADALAEGLPAKRLEQAAIEILGLHRHRPARAAIERRLADSDLDLRVAAVRALGRLQAVESASSLLVALKDDAWQVRAQAARSLGRVSAPIAIYALTARLSDPSWWVRHHAAYALADLGEEGRVALRRVIAESTDPYARDMATEALDGQIRRRLA